MRNIVSRDVESLYPPATLPVNTDTANNSIELPEIIKPVTVTLTAGYAEFPCVAVTDPRLSHFAFRLLLFLIALSRPGFPRIDLKYAQIQEALTDEKGRAPSEDTLTAAFVCLESCGYLTRERQRGSDGRRLQYVYDVTKTFKMLPEVQSVFRRTGQKATHADHSDSASPVLTGNKKDVLHASMYVEHNKTKKQKTKSPDPIVVDMNIEELACLESLESLKVGGSVGLVKKFGVSVCNRYIAWFKSYKRDKTPALLYRAITIGYDISDQRNGYDRPRFSPGSTDTPPTPPAPVLSRPLDRETVREPISTGKFGTAPKIREIMERVAQRRTMDTAATG